MARKVIFVEIEGGSIQCKTEKYLKINLGMTLDEYWEAVNRLVKNRDSGFRQIWWEDEEIHRTET